MKTASIVFYDKRICPIPACAQVNAFPPGEGQFQKDILQAGKQRGSVSFQINVVEATVQ
jgi:hypothetical protein